MAPGMVKPHEPALVPTGVINTTDHDSRVMRTRGQSPLQCYNAQLAVNHQQVIVAAEVTTDAPDFGHLEPMVRATQRELRAVDLDDPAIVVADAGYWHQCQIEAVVSDGIQVLVPPDSGLRTTPGGDGPAASTTSCAACSPRPTAAPPTARDRSPSSPSSAS
jgi:hypothetical protein